MIKKVTIKNPKRSPETADNWVDNRESRKTLTLNIPASLHAKLKIMAVKQDQTMCEIICDLIEEKLKTESS